MLAIIAELNEPMLAFAPHHVRPPQKIAMRIYRDIRFSHDKRPYKRNAGAWWSRDGLEKTSGGGYYFHIGPEGLVIAAGVYMPEREQLLAIRRHIAEHHAAAPQAARREKAPQPDEGLRRHAAHPRTQGLRTRSSCDRSAAAAAVGILRHARR